MPTPRRVLGVISGNVAKRKELTPYKRAQVITNSLCGLTPVQISRDLNIPDSTVRDTILNHVHQPSGVSKPRTGRPKCYTIRDERVLLRYARQLPFSTYDELLTETGLKISRTTVKTILRTNGISNWRAKKRPELTERHVAERLLWCRCRANWSVDRWRAYMWSDECSVERGSGKRGVWVFRTPVQKWHKDYVQMYHKGKDISVMVWACFWGKANGGIGRSELYIMDRDFESKKHGYSAQSYIEVLEDQLPKCWEPGLEFMQDNASIHTARVVRDWFKEMGIPLIDWPPMSPDLNPIEHVWWHLKKKVLDMHPELQFMGAGEEAMAALESALREAWTALPDSLFESLIQSMPRRVAACIAADGWHTKY